MGRVRHVRSGGEVQVLTPAEMVFVDGFDQEINTIYEFYGCYFHGCSRCFPRNRDVRRNCHKDRTVNEVYYATERKAAMLRQAGYQVIEKWDCDFNQDKKTDPQLKSFLQDLEMVPPLEPTEKSLKTNVFIAIFTTAHAPLKLFEALETLQERVLYYDTDSVIYKWRPG